MIKTIGFTYDLQDEYLKEGYTLEEVAECDKIETITEITRVIEELGYIVCPIGNILQLTKRLVNGERWDMVFNICEGITGHSRESQVPSLLEAYKIPYVFSNPSVLSLTLHKDLAKLVLMANGLITPRFKIIKNPEDILEIDLTWPLFVKPGSEGTSKGIDSNSKVSNIKELKKKVTQIFESGITDILVEEYLPGREFTVGIIGSGEKARIYGIMEIIVKNPEANGIYSYNVKDNYLEDAEYKMLGSGVLKDKITELCLKSWNILGCLDGGRVDVKIDGNFIPSFIEVNPLAGLNPGRSDLPIMGKLMGLKYKDLIKDILNAAVTRIGNK